ncbi:MAG: class I SAM-dependent methyltransferase [Patescibacteria group bacterium]
MEELITKNVSIESCPICYKKNPIKFDKKNGFEILKCSGCDLLWTPNIDEKVLSDFYSKSYFESQDNIFGYSNYIEDEEILRINARYILSEFPKFKDNSPKMLDIGCAHGFLLDESRKLGWETKGLEFSAEAASYAVNKLNLNVSVGSIMQTELPENNFDIITMIGVMEHLADPIAAIRKVNKLLKPGGYLAITTINTKGFVRLFDLKPPEHIFYFSAKNLSLLLERENFKVVKQSSYWCHYHLNEALDRAFRLIFKPNRRIEKLLGLIPFFKIPIKVPTNEMFILSQKEIKS